MRSDPAAQPRPRAAAPAAGRGCGDCPARRYRRPGWRAPPAAPDHPAAGRGSGSPPPSCDRAGDAPGPRPARSWVSGMPGKRSASDEGQARVDDGHRETGEPGHGRQRLGDVHGADDEQRGRGAYRPGRTGPRRPSSGPLRSAARRSRTSSRSGGGSRPGRQPARRRRPASGHRRPGGSPGPAAAGRAGPPGAGPRPRAGTTVSIKTATRPPQARPKARASSSPMPNSCRRGRPSARVSSACRRPPRPRYSRPRPNRQRPRTRDRQLAADTGAARNPRSRTTVARATGLTGGAPVGDHARRRSSGGARA